MTEDEAKNKADAAIMHICRFTSRITEFATHQMVDEHNDGYPIWDFDPMIMQVCDEEMPGSVAGSETDLREAVKTAYPHYRNSFLSAFAEYQNVKNMRADYPDAYWQEGYPRAIPWMQDSLEAVNEKRRLDEHLSALFWYTKRLYEINATL